MPKDTLGGRRRPRRYGWRTTRHRRAIRRGDELFGIKKKPDKGWSLDEIEEDLLANGAYPKVGFILIDQGDYDYHAINYGKLKHSVIYVDPQLGKVVRLKRDLTVELGLPRP